MEKNNNQIQDIDIYFIISVLINKKYLIFFITLIIFLISFLFNYEEYKYKGTVYIKFDKINTFIIENYFTLPKKDFSKVKNEFFIKRLTDQKLLENTIDSIYPEYKLSKKASQILKYEINDYYKYTFVKVTYDIYFGSNNKKDYENFIIKHIENSINIANDGFESEYNYVLNKNIEVKKENLEETLDLSINNLEYLNKKLDNLKKEDENENILNLKLKIMDEIFHLQYKILRQQQKLDKFLIDSNNILFNDISKKPGYVLESMSIKEIIKEITYQLPALIGGFLLALIFSSVLVFFRKFDNSK